MEEDFIEHFKKEGRDEKGKKISRKQFRANLMLKNPYCHWCKVLLDDSPEAHKKYWPNGEHPPNNAATVEHIFDKFDYRRYLYHRDEFKVLDCRKCNLARSELHVKNMPRDVLEKRKKLLLERKERGDKTPRALLFLRAGLFAIDKTPTSMV